MAKRLGYSKVYFTFDCVGDTILLMSALWYLSQQKSQKLLVGTLYKELLKNCDYLEVLDDFCEDNLCFSNYKKLLNNGMTPIFISSTDFVWENGVYRPIWGKYHILANICSKLGIDSQIDITTRMFLDAKEKESGRFFESDQIAIVSAGNQLYKEIPFDVAQTVVNHLKHSFNFVQVGSLSDPPLSGVLDKRSWGGLRGTASILYNSDVFIGGIGGLMHMARAVGCRSVITYSVAEPIHLGNYACNINIFASTPRCNMCGDNRCFPYLTRCPNMYSCIRGIKSSDVEKAVTVQMSKKNVPLEVEKLHVTPTPAVGIDDYLKRFGKLRS